MQEELVGILRCTMCSHAPLGVAASERAGGGEVLTGALHCPACGRDYPIEDGIPILLPDGLREVRKNDVERWMEARKSAEQSFIDEDIRTYKDRFRDCARTEGTDEGRDSYLWEYKLYEETIAKFGEQWEEVPAKLGVKWVRPGEGESARNDAFLDAVRGREGSLAGKRVFNVGSGGDANLVRSLEAMGARVLNCDIVPDALKHLARVYRKAGGAGGMQGICGDLTRLPLADGALDAVLCVEVIHHLQPIEKGLAEAMRVLAPAGGLYLLEVNPHHAFTYPGKILPKAAKRWIRRAIRRFFGAKERYLQGSPYEQILPIDEFASAMTRLGLAGVGKRVVVHPPSVLPPAVIRLWERAGRRFPGIFDRFALEFALWGRKAPEGADLGRARTT